MAASHPTQEPLLLPLASDRATLPLAGGKGANLARLVRAGFPVPHGFVISTEAYASFVAANDLARHILSELEAEGRAADLSGGEAHEATSSRIRARFSEATMPASFWDQILAAYAGLGRPPVAVRSSATAEDLPDMSFAGQQDTFLNVIGDEALLAAVTACWSSLWTARAISYREHNRVSHGDVSIAVVVQKMVQSEAAGVLFTANPLTGLRTETVIDATLGLGEALVGGRVQPDHYVVDRCTGQITSRALGAKVLSIRGKDGGGTETVAESAAATQALPDAQILELAALGDRVAGMFDAPQDIEWAWADSALSLLQARPITSLFPVPPGLDPEPLRVMLSFGAVQGMLDPVTPLGRDLFFHLVVAVGQLFGMALRPETQNALFVAGERPWINLTPLVRNTVGRRIVPVITLAADPGVAEALGAILHEPQLQPERRGVRPRAALQILRFILPVAGNVLLNLMAPGPRRRFIVSRGERLLHRSGHISGIAGDPQERLGQLARISAAFVAERAAARFASSCPAWQRPWRPTTSFGS